LAGKPTARYAQLLGGHRMTRSERRQRKRSGKPGHDGRALLAIVSDNRPDTDPRDPARKSADVVRWTPKTTMTTTPEPIVRLIERSKHLNARELERLVAAQRCPYPVSASTHSIDQAEASWWATKSLAVSDGIEEAAYEAGRRGAKQSACNATGRGLKEKVWRVRQPRHSQGPMHALVAYHDAVEALVMKDVRR